MTQKQVLIDRKLKSREQGKKIIIPFMITLFALQLIDPEFYIRLIFMIIIGAFLIIKFIIDPKAIFCKNCDHNLYTDTCRKDLKGLEEYNFCPSCGIDLNEKEKL